MRAKWQHLLASLPPGCRRHVHFKAKPQQTESPPPPPPPKPPQKPVAFSLHGETWEDPYSWMSDINNKVAMRHMNIHMEHEAKYTEAIMSDTERIQSKLQSEIASRTAFELSTPALRWGPWLYYRRVEEGKQYQVLCRRLARLNDEFISNKLPSAGFDYTSGLKIEQKLLDYNQEAERFGGYSYEGLSEISPDHRFLAYTMYDKDNDYFKLFVRDLNSHALLTSPQACRVSSLAWAKGGKSVLYVVMDEKERPFRIYCSIIGSIEEDVLLLEDLVEDARVCIRNTKDFRYVTVNRFTRASSKIFLINADNPLSGLILVWECEGKVHCVVEHHERFLYLFTDAPRGEETVDSHYLLCCPVEPLSGVMSWENLIVDDPNVMIEDVEFSATHMVLILREAWKLRLCSVPLPLPKGKDPFDLKSMNPTFLPLPDHVSHISPGPNYDYWSSTMRFTVSSPVMPDAVVDYDLSSGKWNIIQQQNFLADRSRVLYASSSTTNSKTSSYATSFSSKSVKIKDHCSWDDLSEFYTCESYNVPSCDGVLVPLTVVQSRSIEKGNRRSGLLYGHGTYGEVLDKQWCNVSKSLLDRGWAVAYADVRGGGGGGKKWHHDGRGINKHNSIKDYIHCAKFLIEKGMVGEGKLAGWGHSAGGLVIASAINFHPELLRAAILEVPFLDATNTLLYPMIPLSEIDYDEFGSPDNIEEFRAIREYSPYDNVRKDALYPAILVSSSLHTRFGVWEAVKWVARVRERTIHDPKHPVLLSLITDVVEENRYLQCKESALHIAFLLKVMAW